MGLHSNRAVILVNVVIWVSLVLLFAVIGQFGSPESDTGEIVIWASAGVLTFIFPITLFNTRFLIPRFLMRQKYVAYIVMLMIFTPVWTVCTGVIDHFVFVPLGIGTDENTNDDVFDDVFTFAPYFVMFFFVAMSTLINLSYRWFFQLQKIQAFEKAQISSELALLKAQINPHFFFNTLNNLYALALENSPKTPSTILVLSNLMRYVIYDANTEKIGLTDEVKYIENYVELQKIRLLRPENASFEVNVKLNNVKLPPLLLIIFIENAFKYSISTMADKARIHIFLDGDEAQINFTIENNYDPSQMKSTHGIGLANARKRLDLLYGKNYQLTIRDESSTYTVNLKLPAE